VLLPALENKNGELDFILTDVTQDQYHPSLWGFEVFTGEWQRLALFTYKIRAGSCMGCDQFRLGDGENCCDIAVAGPAANLVVPIWLFALVAAPAFGHRHRCSDDAFGHQI